MDTGWISFYFISIVTVVQDVTYVVSIMVWLYGGTTDHIIQRLLQM